MECDNQKRQQQKEKKNVIISLQQINFSSHYSREREWNMKNDCVLNEISICKYALLSF